VIREQRDRYGRSLEDLRTPPGTMKDLKDLRKRVLQLEKG